MTSVFALFGVSTAGENPDSALLWVLRHPVNHLYTVCEVT